LYTAINALLAGSTNWPLTKFRSIGISRLSCSFYVRSQQFYRLEADEQTIISNVINS
jgi:hypothetical protein